MIRCEFQEYGERVAHLVPSDAQAQLSDSRAGASSSVYCSLCQAGTYGTGSGKGLL